jgi:very-short-patch-repair endonuclease/ribosomal protein L37E
MTKNNPTLVCRVCGTLYWGRRRHACSKACGYESKFRRFMAEVETRAGEALEPAIRRRLATLGVEATARELGISDGRALKRIMARLGIPAPSRSESIRKQWIDAPARRAKQAERLRRYVRADPDRARRNSITANLKLQTTSPTSIERRLTDALDAAGIAYEFQYVVGDKFLCDFAFPSARLVVETDGSYWHRTPRQRKQDASKDAYLHACGFTVLRLSDVHVRQHLTRSVAAIQALLNQPPEKML